MIDRLTSIQKAALAKYYGNDLAKAIAKVILENHSIGYDNVNFIYDDEIEVDLRLGTIERKFSAIEKTIEEKILPRLERLIMDVDNFYNGNFEKRIHKLEHVIRPDETDVHNINRRIELLAQRISGLENSSRGWFRK